MAHALAEEGSEAWRWSLPETRFEDDAAIDDDTKHLLQAGCDITRDRLVCGGDADLNQILSCFQDRWDQMWVET